MEAFNTSYNEQDEWERDAKQTLDECLPIEADLDRLNEQQDILEVRGYTCTLCMCRSHIIVGLKLPLGNYI